MDIQELYRRLNDLVTQSFSEFAPRVLAPAPGGGEGADIAIVGGKVEEGLQGLGAHLRFIIRPGVVLLRIQVKYPDGHGVGNMNVLAFDYVGGVPEPFMFFVGSDDVSKEDRGALQALFRTADKLPAEMVLLTAAANICTIYRGLLDKLKVQPG